MAALLLSHGRALSEMFPHLSASDIRREVLGAGGSPAATLDDAVTRLLGLEFDGLVCVVSLGPVAAAEAVAPAAVLPGAPAPPSPVVTDSVAFSEAADLVLALGNIDQQDAWPCAKSLHTIYARLARDQQNPASRLLRLENAAFAGKIWRHAPARALLAQSGFVEGDQRGSAPPFRLERVLQFKWDLASGAAPVLRFHEVRSLLDAVVEAPELWLGISPEVWAELAGQDAEIPAEPKAAPAAPAPRPTANATPRVDLP